MTKNNFNIFVLIVMLSISSNLSSQNIKCNDIKWVDYEINTDTLYAYLGKVKLAEINGNIFNQINEVIIKEFFFGDWEYHQESSCYYLSHYFLTKPTYTLNIGMGFTEFSTNIYCLNHVFSYQLECYTIGAQVPCDKYLSYDLKKKRKINLEDIVKSSEKESFDKFIIDYLNNNKKEIIENLKELLSHTTGVYTLNYSEVLDNSAYNLNSVLITDSINLKYFNSKGIVFSLKLRDFNFLEIENAYMFEDEVEVDSYILIPYDELREFIHKDFYCSFGMKIKN